MKFNSFRRFSLPKSFDLREISRFLSSTLSLSFAELATGLNKLSLDDNFESFTVEVEIAAGAEKEIRNELLDFVPSKRIVVRGNGASIVDGDTKWTRDYVYLKNTGAATATVTVIFLR